MGLRTERFLEAEVRRLRVALAAERAAHLRTAGILVDYALQDNEPFGDPPLGAVFDIAASLADQYCAECHGDGRIGDDACGCISREAPRCP